MFEAFGVIKTHAKQWRYKKNIPNHLQSWAIQVNCGINGYRWIVENESGAILMNDDSYCKTHRARLNCGRNIIGNRDAEILGNLPFADEWKKSLFENNKNKF